MKVTTSLPVTFFAAWCVLLYAFFATIALLSGDPKMRAMLGMVTGLLGFWVLIGGSAMYLGRGRVRKVVQKIPVDWRWTFVLFCTLLALLEEAVTTTMTNLAPLFGVRLGEVMITASMNYFEVVTQHSVVVFVPMFIVWAWLLSRYAFSPGAVFLLFGLTGTLAETLSFGSQSLFEAGMWVFVYGLMVYLPAYCVPSDRGARQPWVLHYAVAVVAPIVLMIPIIPCYVLWFLWEKIGRPIRAKL